LAQAISSYITILFVTTCQNYEATDMGILLVALFSLLMSGIGLKRDVPDHHEGDQRQDPSDPDESEDIGLVSTILSEFEHDAAIYDSLKSTKAAQKVAVVAVGHVRTFILPGVYSSIDTNLMDTFPGTANLFFIAHLGKYVDKWAHGANDVDVKSYLKTFNGSEETAVTFALNNMKEYPTHVEIHSGCSCNDLMDARKQFGTTGPKCDSANGHLMQVLWMDHAFQQIDRYGVYDLVVRIRPDVAVFKPFPWKSLSKTGVTWAKKKDGYGMIDWTFALPSLFLTQTWPSVVGNFVEQSKRPEVSPDIAWHAGFSKGKQTIFPSVVVRSAGSANCQHVSGYALYSECLSLCSQRWFMKKH